MTGLDKLVGVSVSDPGKAENERHGTLNAHTRHAFVEIVRQIFAAGGSFAYGGHLEAEGYTDTLLSLLRTYSLADRPAAERVHQYLARPTRESLTAQQELDLATYATPVEVPAVGEGDDRVALAREFTAMRELMNEDIDARIVMGGKLVGYVGRWPGVVEEAYLAIEHGRCVYVVGGLGGAAERVARAVRGEWPSDLEADPEVPGRSQDELRAIFDGADLRNGLDDEENEQLMCTTDLDLIVALILRGLVA
jgi:hypothetical protein